MLVPRSLCPRDPGLVAGEAVFDVVVGELVELAEGGGEGKARPAGGPSCAVQHKP